ncbi:MAG: hypothetical protein K2X41_04075 [Hyphomicrobium sp.]|nr:hypothetical protein [Hyphomicrobium sp.]
MAPRRKKLSGQFLPTPGREFKLRIPEDIAARIEKRAKDEIKPMNRIVINELASIPHLEKLRDLGDAIEDMKIVLARHSARLTLADLGEPLLQAVDAVLAASNDSELQTRLDKLRVLRADMLKKERTSKE